MVNCNTGLYCDSPEQEFIGSPVSLKHIFTLNTNQYDVQTMLLTCIVNPDPVIEEATKCRKYLDDKFIKEIQSKRFKQWIKTYKFE